MSSQQFTEIFGARYMRDFQCAGPECPDTCCAGWKVEVDKSHYKKIKKKLSSSAAGKKRFNEAIKRNRSSNADDLAYAVIATDKEKNCLFLQTDRWCQLQREFGEGILPNTCASYPRSMIAREQRLEVYGVMSCPVVAESVLLSEKPFDLLDIPASEGVQRSGSIRYSIQEGDAYDYFFDDVRGFVLNLLLAQSLSFEQKVYVLSRFAAELHEEYRRGCDLSVGPRLAELIARYRQPAAQEKLMKEFQQIPDSDAASVNEVMQLLMAGVQSLSVTNSTFKSYIDSLLAAVDIDTDNKAWDQPTTERFLNHYQYNKHCGDGSVWQLLDESLLRYSINHWLSVPYLITDTLLGFIQNWVLRVASLRLLVMSNPAWQQAEAMPEDEQKVLFVQVFQQYGRGIESRPDYIRAILERYQTDDALTALAQTLLFLKI
jgi:lysine-N-methylase